MRLGTLIVKTYDLCGGMAVGEIERDAGNLDAIKVGIRRR